MNYTRLQKLNGQTVPDPNTEEFLYQSLLGAWPLAEEERPEFIERFKNYMLKAAREAKVQTSWLHQNEAYEKALLAFVDSILNPDQNEFLEEFIHFQKEIGFYGALNALSQTLLKIASPGLPDFFQGMELWNLSLVDPDNRRPVDFGLRKQLLNDLMEKEKQDRAALLEEISGRWQDGRVKLYLTYKALHFRKEHFQIFQSGEYLPVRAEGKRQECVIAFARRAEGEWAIAAVPRFFTRLVQPARLPLGRRVWQADTLVLPEGAPGEWTNVLTGENISINEEGSLELSGVFNSFPLALLASRQG